ncbi:nickel/cobalt transporter [Hyphomicrobium sp. DY-1]|uniref:nickel/cobalt transporter n=1 Tax=Hyphomicrobium sp. DY-1 TaxID=3075650 RepID=UPI0039C039C9
MGHWKSSRTASRRLGKRAAWAAAWAAGIFTMVMSLGLAAHANEAPTGPKSAFGFAGAMQAQPVREPSMITQAMDAAWSILLFEQHRFTQNMTGAVRNLKSTTNVMAATGALVVASFIYGILHAVGPGHGKAVISSYMLADKETLRRGIFLAFLSSLIQALSAITLIGGLYVAALATGLQTKWAEAWLETLSWGAVALLGAWLMFKQLWPMFTSRRQPVRADQLYGDDHEHGHDHGCSHDHHGQAAPASCGHDHSHDHSHGCGHDHVHDEHCGHAHLPGPDELRGKLSWSRALAIAFSIGMRPCTGALLVIIFAATQGMIWAGILATFAMAFGTALTVSALAAVSVGSRNLAIILAGAESRWGDFVARSASVVSSAAVFVLGTVFFFASFHDVRPF